MRQVGRWTAGGLAGAGLLLAVPSCSTLLGLGDVVYASEDAGTDASANSCVVAGPGMNTCPGGSGAESCCASLSVEGGTFLRGYDGLTYIDESNPASVSGFRLDEYEITVGRFRQFVDAVTGPSAWAPVAGWGKHTHLPDGGLNGGTETGWDPSWTSSLATTYAGWTENLTCAKATWTPTVGSNENLPIDCVTWFEAYAFCIWDGGFLPSEAEWNYAAAGGGDSMGQRVYPWSVEPKSTTIDCTYANYSPEGGAACVPSGPNDVGSEARGAGRFGQADLAGNTWEWVLDWYVSPYPNPCVDCAALTTTSATPERVFRGGSFKEAAPTLFTSPRATGSPTSRYSNLGARCARSP